MVEATKGIGRKYRKGATKDFPFLIVVSPPRRRQNMHWELVPSWLVWWRQTPKDSESRPLISLQMIGLEVLTLCWGESLWYPRTGRLFLSATSRMCGMFYILLLQTTQGAQIQVFTIYPSILTNLITFPFSLLLVPLLCQKNMLLMRLTPTTNQGSMIWYWRSGVLLNVVGWGYIRQFLWAITITNFWKLFHYGVNREHYENFIGIREFSEQLAQYFFNNTFHLILGPQQRTYPPLMRLMIYMQFLIAVHFIFLVVSLTLQRPEIFPT